MIIGIDTGGTNVDAALVAEDGIANTAKVPNDDRRETIEAVLADLLSGWDSHTIERVVVATTLVVNAAVQYRLPDCSNVVIPGPGLSPERAFYGDADFVAAGGVDPRGRVTEPVAFDERVDHSVVAVTGKFSARNPDLERSLRDSIEADHVSIGSESGAGFTFPQRAGTTVGNAKAKPAFLEFRRDVEAAVESAGIEAPVYYLKSDGAMLDAESTAATPAHTLRGGSAASALGLRSLSGVEDAVTIDVGGTTTDVTRVEDGFPAVESGMQEGEIEPAYDGVVSRSLPIGGDTLVVRTDGSPTLADERVGNAAAFGGAKPTVTDALHVLGVYTAGDTMAAESAIRTLGDEAPEAIATAVLDRFLDRVHAAIDDVVNRGTSTLVVGGVLAPYLADPLVDRTDLNRVVVPDHANVAGAVGCGVARVSVATAVHADSARGVMTVTSVGPESVESIEQGRRFTGREAREIAIDRAGEAAVDAGGDPSHSVEIQSFSRYDVVEDATVVGEIFDAEAQVRPAIEFDFSEETR